MLKILQLKHWQIFLMIISACVILSFCEDDPFVFTKTKLVLTIVFLLIEQVVTFGWIYILGLNLHKKLDNSQATNLTRFRISLLCLIIVINCNFIYWINWQFIEQNHFDDFNLENILELLIVVPVIIVCGLNCFHFLSKTLTSVELRRTALYDDYILEIFLFLYYFPIGLWFLQPRINKIFIDSDNAALF